MNMASNRRKQDEKHLKTLRELVSLAANRNCFECNQRGPTYVDVTVGSFVCTKCSGMLRGLTPPHRVKSISMATFTAEEIEVLKTRGNEHCQQVWLGLYEGSKPTDEDGLQTLMRDKYERKRFYMEPGIALRNTYNNNNNKQRIIDASKTMKANGSIGNNFVADFAHADIFNASDAAPPTSTTNFANFSNDNPIFCNETAAPASDDFSIFDLQFTHCGPVYNQVSLFPRMNPNRWHNQHEMNGNVLANATSSSSSSSSPSSPPSTNAQCEDKYAALKDLDNAAKSAINGGTHLDWPSSIGSNSSLYSSPTTTPGSFYSTTTSPQSSSYGGSPSQGQFMNTYPALNVDTNVAQQHVSNPFASNINGSAFNGNHHHHHHNPFRATPPDDFVAMMSSPFGNADVQSAAAFITPPINATTWTPNPFKIANGHSSNPFL